MKTVLLESLSIDEELEQLEEPFKKKGMEFVSYERTQDEDTIVQEADGADVLILGNMPLSNAAIQRMNTVRYIDVGFTGVDHIGLDACRAKKIAVSNASGYASEAVSELTIATVLDFYRSLRKAEDQLRQGRSKESLLGSELYGKTVGIIGLGKIGMRSAELFHAFGCHILANKKHPCEEPEWITLTDLDTVLKQSDIVVLHCPLNDETRNMINRQKFSLMKKNALLVNMARGPVVNTHDLIQALNEAKIAGAVSDVFDTEPPLKKDNPILKAPNTLLTPHIGFATKEAMHIRGQIVFDNLEAWLNGKQKNIIL